MIEAAARVQVEIGAALDEHGLGRRRLVPISRFQGRKHGRYAFLALAEDGRKVKARHLVSAEDAQRLCELREGLEPAFAPVLGRHGAVLVEKWIEGVGVGEEEAARRTGEAGSLLGRLHAAPPPPPVGGGWRTAGYLETALADLELLLEGRSLAPAEADALREALSLNDPGSFSPALIHRDFCPENFVIDEDGRLTAIDNEWFTVGAAGFDLARTYHRWPMPADAWARLLEGYRSAAAPPEAMPFWMIASTLWGARVYVQLMPSWAPPLIDLLRELADGGQPHEAAPR